MATTWVSGEQVQVINAIENCRTSALGGHVEVCARCDHAEIAYNSCRNRHCPKCQCLAQARWLDGRKARILPVPYFHVVFTLPAELRNVARRNRRLIYGLLFEAASATLLELGRDPKRLDGTLGLTAVLHTWTHPHLHCVVTGGALAADESRWVPSDGTYLFPVQVMSRLFRGKFTAGLEAAWQDGRLQLEDEDPVTFARLRGALFAREWVVYAKRPFAGPQQVFTYLGLYTHRVGISNHRILEVTPNLVRIATKNGGQASMEPREFIRRFLQHVLPHRFVKIRHYGLMASVCVTTKLATAARLLEVTGVSSPSTVQALGWCALLTRLTGVDLRRCPACQQPAMMRRSSSRLLSFGSARAPPAQSVSP
jgi:hypothetical protein